MKDHGRSDKSLNPICVKCLRPCKQPAVCLLVDCPRYYPLPFKVERHRFQQMDLFSGKKKP